MDKIIGSIGLGLRNLYFINCLGKSLNHEDPVVKCGSRMEESGKFTSVIETGGSGSIVSANSVSLKI